MSLAVEQRDDFAGVLRSYGVVRYDSHQVARNPGRLWSCVIGSDGYVRMQPAAINSTGIDPNIAHLRWRLERAGIRVVRAFRIRWKRLP